MKSLLSLLLIPLLSGCVLSKPNGNIVSVTSTVIGIKVGQNPVTQNPELQLGFFRSTFQIVPTATNQIFAPAVNSSLSLDQKAFSTQIDEDFTAGGAQAPPDSVAKRGAMSRGKAPMTSMSTAKTNTWPMLPWNKDVPPLHPTR